MKIYAISGLGADKRVFQYLNLAAEVIPLDWIKPAKKEPIESYASRLSTQVTPHEKIGIMGVSFGGLIAVEMSKLLKPAITILISSAETNKELPKLYRLIGRSGLVEQIPATFFDPPRWSSSFLFGTKRKKLLNQILGDTDLIFAKWAVNELVNWNNEERVSNPIVKISGSKDKLIPPTHDENSIVIRGGQHFMVVDRAKEISDLINQHLENLAGNHRSSFEAASE